MKNTKKITGRRTLRFSTLAQALADIEQITAAPHKALGNWTAAGNIDHLAKGIEVSLDGYPAGFKPPLFLRLFGRLIRGSMMKNGVPAGIQPPAAAAELFAPRPNVTLEQALARYRTATERFANENPIPRNPLFGPMTKSEWEQFLCGHADLHHSFIVPDDNA